MSGWTLLVSLLVSYTIWFECLKTLHMMCYCAPLHCYFRLALSILGRWSIWAHTEEESWKKKKDVCGRVCEVEWKSLWTEWSSFINFNFPSFFFLISALCHGALVLCYVLLVILLSLCIAAGCPSFHCLYQFFLILMNF